MGYIWDIYSQTCNRHAFQPEKASKAKLGLHERETVELLGIPG
jgi:hypothetical protein